MIVCKLCKEEMVALQQIWSWPLSLDLKKVENLIQLYVTHSRKCYSMVTLTWRFTAYEYDNYLISKEFSVHSVETSEVK